MQFWWSSALDSCCWHSERLAPRERGRLKSHWHGQHAQQSRGVRAHAARRALPQPVVSPLLRTEEGQAAVNVEASYGRTAGCADVMGDGPREHDPLELSLGQLSFRRRRRIPWPHPDVRDLAAAETKHNGAAAGIVRPAVGCTPEALRRTVVCVVDDQRSPLADVHAAHDRTVAGGINLRLPRTGSSRFISTRAPPAMNSGCLAGAAAGAREVTSEGWAGSAAPAQPGRSPNRAVATSASVTVRRSPGAPAAPVDPKRALFIGMRHNGTHGYGDDPPGMSR